MHDVLLDSVVAGLLASVACGVGVVPLFIGRLNLAKHVGLGYGFAGGLMFAASVYNLILPGLTLGSSSGSPRQVLLVILGILLGAGFLWLVGRYLEAHETSSTLRTIGTRQEILIFVAMAFHSIPEGVAVGVGYASALTVPDAANLGDYIAVAIGLHNMPEGLAIAIPMRAAGAGLRRCFTAAFLTSLPQPLAALPAAWLVSIFQPLMLPLLGFAAGAMIFLILLELIPDALHERRAVEIAWAFTLGFCLMILLQVFL